VALNSLPLFHRVAGQRVVVVGDGDAAESKRRLVERAGAVCCGEPEAHHARLAFVALDDARAAEAAALRLRGKGLLVNVTDRPELCDFTVPSVLERGPVLVAVGTGGASAGLAKQLRLRLEAILPHTLGALADALHAARGRMRERWPDPTARRAALDAALTNGGVLDPFDQDASGKVENWLNGSDETSGGQTVEVQLRSEDPDDLTLREARLLGTADAVMHDLEVPGSILIRARADAVRLAAGAGQPEGARLIVVLRAPQ
jgi:uroporphyrin-III C-methyltransferase/precorrin-2 dehydrogenase/sirohydrochlorin ferrochelatase